VIAPSERTKVYLCTRVTDMRKSFNGLIALTRHVIDQDPLSGHWFVFVNRNRDYLKLLYYADGGYCLWCKRLEQGRFSRVASVEDSVQLSHTQLLMWINGIALEQRGQQKRYRAPATTNSQV